MASSAVISPRRRTALLWQVLILLLVWFYLVGLHPENDGLWFPGDAPRHAANGVFWKDLIAALPVNPIDFAVNYYLRYPVISPSAYPPGFYWLEAVAFSLFGVSPFIGKGMVLAFTLMAALYLMAWLSRWVSEEAGWGGALLILQPGVIVWSHAIMLNIPSMALGLAALYHTRRWIETPHIRHLSIAAIFAAVGILTYVHTGVVLLVALVWIGTEHRWTMTRKPRGMLIILGLLSVVVMLPIMVAFKWAPIHLSLVFPSVQQVSRPSHWLYYLTIVPKLISVPTLILALAGVVIGIRHPDRRREVKLALIWLVIGYLILSYILAKELRYALLLVPPIVILSMIGLLSLTQWGAGLRGRPSPGFFHAGLALILAVHLWGAARVFVPVVDGFQDIVAFLIRKATHERIFYEGRLNGVFSFYMRAEDPKFQRTVVRGSKLLYASAIDAQWHLIQRVASPAEVIEVLRKECGCKWLVIERAEEAATRAIPAVDYLRAAVRGPEFELITSFRIHVDLNAGENPDDGDVFLDVYQFLSSIEVPDGLEFRMPILGEGAVIHGKPIER
jgi:4-amino-4-deoxy-L-arabinose transferase-like glycosyltransferase